MLTEPQTKALCALARLRHTKGDHFFLRWEAGQLARWDCNSYPIKTMRALERHGYVENDSEAMVLAVETGRCRCSCDRWRITPSGMAHVLTLNISFVQDRKD